MRGAGIACAALLAACGGEPEVASDAPSSAVLYGPAAETELTLFPSNRYTVADASTPTGLRVHVGADNTKDQLATAYPITLAELGELDGFSTVGGVAARFSGPLEPASFLELDAAELTKPGAPLHLVSLDDGEPVGIVPRYYEQEKDVDYPSDDFTLIAEPAVPLRPASRYVFVVTRALHARDGSAVGRASAMHRALTSSDEPYDVELREAVGAARDVLGIDAADVAAATLFTTGSVTRDVIALGKARRAAAPPVASESFSVQQAPSATDPRVRFRAAFPAAEYRRPQPNGKWELDATGVAKAQKSVALETFLAFSDSTASGKRPVVIFQHGLGGDKDGGWGTAERLAALSPNGVAVFAIDSPEHGSRGSGSSSPVTSAFSFFGVDEGSLEFDIGRARDNFRQMAFDQLELVRFIGTLGSLDLLPLGADGQPAPDGVPDLDVSRILYIGHSFGSVQGATVFALAPEITQATWNVGGAGLMMLLRDSKLFSLGVVKTLTPPGTPFGAVARFMSATQAIVDPGDPLNYARYGTLEALEGVPGWKPRDVLIQEVVADNIVPNSTSEALGRAAGAGILGRVTVTSGLPELTAPVTTNVKTGATSVIAQFAKMDGGKTANHGELIFSPQARAQYVQFFTTGLGAEHATVSAP